MRRFEPLLELLELELLLFEDPFDELPLEEPPERDTPEEEEPEFEERREVLVELLLEPREELERLSSCERRETLLLSELSRFEVRRSEVEAGCRVSVGVSREPAGRATEVLPEFGILTTSLERESVSVLVPRRAERRPSLVRLTASVRVSVGESATVRRVRR